MQWLLGGLAALVQVIVSFFIGFVTKKTAQIIAALGLAAAVSGALIVALGFAISSVVISAPTGWVAFGIGLLPYNTPACIAAVIGGNLARWLYDWQTRVISYSLT